jgi:hypothetical protein
MPENTGHGNVCKDLRHFYHVYDLPELTLNERKALQSRQRNMLIYR